MTEPTVISAAGEIITMLGNVITMMAEPPLIYILAASIAGSAVALGKRLFRR